MKHLLQQPAPNFNSLSDDGERIHLQALRGQWVVLFFYPRAGSQGCSLEAKRIEQHLPAFQQLGAKIIGISSDTEAAQAKMRLQCQLNFPLLPDSNQHICKAYGAMSWLGERLNMARRSTVLIDPQGIVRAVWPTVNPINPATEVLSTLQQLQAADA